jgi:hypothetical protein
MEAGERGEGEVAPDSVRAYGRPPDSSLESGREVWLGAMRCRESEREEWVHGEKRGDSPP